MSLFEVIGNVGGVQQVVLFIVGFIISVYSEKCLEISMINYIYDVKTEDSSLECKEGKLEISSIDKVQLITNIFPNKKMKRFIKKGTKRLEKDLDIIGII